MKERLSVFSEQESALRNRAFSHGFWVLAALIVIDHVLAMFEIQLPFGTGLGFLYVAVAGAVVTLELIIYGAYSPQRIPPKFWLAFMLAAMLFAGARLAMIIYSHVAGLQLEVNPLLAPFVDPLGYERRVESIIFFSLLVLVFVCGTVRAIYDMRKAEKK